MATRLIDATTVEVYRSSTRPIDDGALASLDALVPFPGARAAVPLLPPNGYGAAAAKALAAHADMLEPLTAAAYPAYVTPGTIVVDPHARPLDAPAHPPPGPVPPEAIREQVAWLPRLTPDVSEAVAGALALVAVPDRLRILDPYGTLTADDVTALATVDDAARLTFVPEAHHADADAQARRILAVPEGPLVRTTLLGIGPRCGLAATEHHVPADARPALRPLAERLALILDRPVPDRHPLWGAHRHRNPEPELLDHDTPVWNAATAGPLIARALVDHGIDVDPDTQTALTERLLPRLRPGETLDGPTLYAFLATHVDLLAGDGRASIRPPRGERA